MGRHYPSWHGHRAWAPTAHWPRLARLHPAPGVPPWSPPPARADWPATAAEPASRARLPERVLRVYDVLQIKVPNSTYILMSRASRREVLAGVAEWAAESSRSWHVPSPPV